VEFTNSSFHLRTTSLYSFNLNTPNPGVTSLQGQSTTLNQQHALSHLQDPKKEMSLLSTSLSFILKDTTSKSIPQSPLNRQESTLIYRSHEGLSGPDAIDLYIGDNGMHFRFHKTVLNAYTSYFNEFFRNMPMAAINEIYLPELDPDRVVELFNKLYLGRREDWDWMDLLPAERK
jgi:BTB/POZ domain